MRHRRVGEVGPKEKPVHGAHDQGIQLLSAFLWSSNTFKFVKSFWGLENFALKLSTW